MCMSPAPDRNQPPLSPADSIERVITGFRAGLDRGSLIHGTCLGALKIAIEQGALPPGRFDCIGRFYVLPLPSRINLPARVENTPLDDSRALKSARGYANTAAAIELAQETLQLAAPSKDERAALSELVFGADLTQSSFHELHVFDSLRARGIEFSHALACREATSNLKGGGVTLSFSSDVVAAYGIEEAPPPDDGHFLKVSTGISLRYLVGIEPHGDVEYDFLSRLGL